MIVELKKTITSVLYVGLNLSTLFCYVSCRATSLQDAIRWKCVSRQAYSWYLNNNLEEITDVERADLLTYLKQYQDAQLVRPSGEKVGNTVCDALESASRYAPHRVITTSFSLQPPADAQAGPVRSNLHASYDPRASQNYVWFYMCAHNLVKNRYTQEAVNELLTNSYKPLVKPLKSAIKSPIKFSASKPSPFEK